LGKGGKGEKGREGEGEGCRKIFEALIIPSLHQLGVREKGKRGKKKKEKKERKEGTEAAASFC